MKHSFVRLFRGLAWMYWVGWAACCSPTGVAGAELVRTHKSRQPVPDVPYLQERGETFASPVALKTVAVLGNEVYAGTDGGGLRLEANRWVEESSLKSVVHRMLVLRGAVWALASDGVYRRGSDRWERIRAQRAADLVEYRGDLIAAEGDRLFRVREGEWEILTTNRAPFSVIRLVPHAGLLDCVGSGRLTAYGAGRFGGRDAYGFSADFGWDWGALPSPEVRDAVSLGGVMYLGTEKGLGVLRGMSLTSLRGEQGLPYEDVTCLARGFTNDLWIGTSRGAIRYVDGSFHYFAGRRWLPHDRVQAITVQGTKVYVATDGGVGIVTYEPYTLAKKASYYERHLEEWGQKRLGFLHKLEWDAGSKEYVREVSDNDGGYTGNYLAAQAYRYAVTGAVEARREATNTFHALRWLEAMTGIPGLPARSVWVKGERGHQAGHGSGGYAAEWHDTADGRFEWKGDTSSDELCSHFYSVGLFLDLVANEREAEQARRHLARMADHLVDHGWKLIDHDGKPTRWGRWDPEYFESDEGKYDRGLQAIELLSFIKTAEVVTGHERFARAYERLIGLGYPEYTLRARNTFPPDSVLHFLDELSFWSWWNLLRFEQDPDRRGLYQRGYERGYEVVRVEQNPWYNYLYGALTGNEVESAAAAEHLRSWPLDMRVWSYRNSHRADLRTPAGYVALKGGTKTFPPRETEPLRWDRWLMQADGGTGGNDVVEPGAWLLAYWMGRYHGYLGAPTVSAPELLSVEHSLNRELGAKAYDGPARPEVP